MTEVNNRLLDTTSAGWIAKKLDAADGNQNGQISASIWNKFVGEIGTGKEIKESISTVAAMNSITTYVIRKAKELNKNVEELAMEWLGNVKEPNTGNAGGAQGSSGAEQAQQGESTTRRGNTRNRQSKFCAATRRSATDNSSRGCTSSN